MKLSVKLQDKHHQQQQNHQKPPETASLLLRAKIPISIFNLPFISGFATTTHHPSDLALSLATNFSSGPALKLSYSTSSPSPSVGSSAATPPLTLSLKSGIGVFGSPKNSPLIISANFSFSPQNPNANPIFSLHFKPELGSFSLRKTTSSNPNPSGKPNGDTNSFGFVPLERPVGFKDFSVENYGKDSILKGISVMARTEMPVAKRVSVNCRWGLNFPEDLGKQMPFLSVNKIGIERVDELKGGKDVKEKNESGTRELDLLKGMCFWMRRELDMLQRENQEMKHRLEEMKTGSSARNGAGEGSGGKKALPDVENLGGFDQWRSKRTGGEESGKKEVKKNGSMNRASDVESELQRAIKAASAS